MSTFSGIALCIVAISSQDVYCAFGRVKNKELGPVDSIPITKILLFGRISHPLFEAYG